MRTIQQIDKDITAVHRYLRRMEARLLSGGDAEAWQAAWDKHPDLYLQERALYQERGVAQLARDEKATNERRRRASRPLKAKKCPTCGNLSYAA